ncbi:hypothetical protein JCM8547_008922 [Rhodosporidiobolus lusitaniae]
MSTEQPPPAESTTSSASPAASGSGTTAKSRTAMPRWSPGEEDALVLPPLTLTFSNLVPANVNIPSTRWTKDEDAMVLAIVSLLEAKKGAGYKVSCGNYLSLLSGRGQMDVAVHGQHLRKKVKEQHCRPLAAKVEEKKVEIRHKLPHLHPSESANEPMAKLHLFSFVSPAMPLHPTQHQCLLPSQDFSPPLDPHFPSMSHHAVATNPFSAAETSSSSAAPQHPPYPSPVSPRPVASAGPANTLHQAETNGNGKCTAKDKKKRDLWDEGIELCRKSGRELSAWLEEEE